MSLDECTDWNLFHQTLSSAVGGSGASSVQAPVSSGSSSVSAAVSPGSSLVSATASSGSSLVSAAVTSGSSASLGATQDGESRRNKAKVRKTMKAESELSKSVIGNIECVI